MNSLTSINCLFINTLIEKQITQKNWKGKIMKTKKQWHTRNINEAAYLKYRGIPINLELSNNNLIIFTAPISDELLSLLSAFNTNDSVPVLSYSDTIRTLKSEMYRLKEIKHG